MWWDLIIKAAFGLIELWAQKKQVDAESRKLFLELAKVLREHGIASAQSRFEAESQIDAGNKAWDDEEKPKP